MQYERTIRRLVDAGASISLIHWGAMPGREPDDAVAPIAKVVNNHLLFVTTQGMRCYYVRLNAESLKLEDILLTGQAYHHKTFLDVELTAGIQEWQREELDAWWERYESDEVFRERIDENVATITEQVKASPVVIPERDVATWDRMLVNINIAAGGVYQFVVGACLLFAMQDDRAVRVYYYPAAGMSFYTRQYAEMVEKALPQDVHGLYEYLAERAERGSIYVSALSLPERFERWDRYDLVRETFLEHHMV